MLRETMSITSQSLTPIAYRSVTLQIGPDGAGQIVLHLRGKRACLGFVPTLRESLPGRQITEPAIGIAEIEGVAVGRPVA